MPKQAKRAAPAKKLPYSEDVDRKLASLKGRSRNDLTPDHERGASSPLGGGTGSKKGRR
jgi:hypothetical protein